MKSGQTLFGKLTIADTVQSVSCDTSFALSGVVLVES